MSVEREVVTTKGLDAWFGEFHARNPERWWWKYRRAVSRVWDFFRYDIHQGVPNLFLFFPVVWRWRGWDYAYDYAVFMRAIELHRRTLLKYHTLVHWKRDAASMDLVLRRWKWFEDELDWDEECRAWDLMHDHLKRNARGWWD